MRFLKDRASDHERFVWGWTLTLFGIVLIILAALCVAFGVDEKYSMTSIFVAVGLFVIGAFSLYGGIWGCKK